jgi:Ca2+-binding EF-hand superfamily protein
MNRNHTSRRRIAVTTALAAFGIASLAVTSSARADHEHDRDGDGRVDRSEDDRGTRYDDYDRYQTGPYGQYRGDTDDDASIYIDLDRYGNTGDFDRHASVDFRYFDRDRNGILDSYERQAYWRHLADMGVFGRSSMTNEIAALAKQLDRDGDGRLTSRESILVRRFISARRMFELQDRDNDNRLYRNETQGWLRAQFYRLDRNRDRRLSRTEVRQHFIRQDDDRPRTWSWSHRW